MVKQNSKFEHYDNFHSENSDSARVGCISEASYTFEPSIFLVHDTAFMHPTLIFCLNQN